MDSFGPSLLIVSLAGTMTPDIPEVTQQDPEVTEQEDVHRMRCEQRHVAD